MHKNQFRKEYTTLDNLTPAETQQPGYCYPYIHLTALFSRMEERTYSLLFYLQHARGEAATFGLL